MSLALLVLHCTVLRCQNCVNKAQVSRDNGPAGGLSTLICDDETSINVIITQTTSSPTSLLQYREEVNCLICVGGSGLSFLRDEALTS